jgi:DNA-directed RNA polymerase II subunit RPB2
MDIARHVLDTYFKDTANPLVRHHLDSFRDLLSTKIPNFIAGMNPLDINLGDGRFIRVYIGGKTAKEIFYSPPVDELGNAVLPHQCRLDNKTYALDIRMNVEIEYEVDGEIMTSKFEDVMLGQIPLMLKSSLCYLAPMTSEELYGCGECRFELGGYFIIGGAEKALLTQERLADNMFYSGKRKQVSGEAPGMKTLVEKESASKIEGATKAEPDEYFAAIKSISEDGTKGPYSHFLVIPPANAKPDDPKKLAEVTDFSQYSTKRLCVITLPDFTQPVPVISVFRALGLTNDQDIYDTVLAGIPPQERTQYDELFAELILSHDVFSSQQMALEKDQGQDPDLLFLKRQTRTRSEGGVYLNLFNKMFPHCAPQDESPPAFYRRKAYLLGYMLRMAMDTALGIRKKTDRDHLRFKRLASSGELVFQEFRRVFKETSKRMLTEMDTRIHFEQQQYAGKKIVELVPEEKIGYFWRAYNFLNEIEKSFKKQWGGKDGVSQEVTRFSFLGTVAQMRRINVDVDKGGKMVDMRRIHGSSWGLMCPIDNPDGRNIGLIKSMTLLCSISTASPSSAVYGIVKKNRAFIPLSSINPSTWDPRWTRVYINSDLVGVLTNNSDTLHGTLIDARRSGTIDKFVSICWNRMENEYLIYTDAGRPARPIYREGVQPQQIKKTTTWESIMSHMDLIDASECEGMRISMEPFHPTFHSEIHGLTILSASTAVLPNCDFDPGTRNAFSCQQVKQACGWYNTAFSKRFDTIATWLNYAQRPLSQTWVYNNILGKSGCLPYGENPIVALMVYTGYNQEDSVLLNDASLKRGFFQTTYYHSYDFEEDALEMGFKEGEGRKPFVLRSTEFGNVAMDPKYRETVTRKEGYNYDLLDGDGIIKPGVEVNEKTILVGKVRPETNQSGIVTGYSDVSEVPKRGQVGFVDAVYRYVNRDGLRAVKIRVAEHRVPVLGDKVSARHGQKGTCGLRIAEEDMPYTAEGVRPDMIVNPHAFPSRMTIGQFIEAMSTKLGVHMGALIDATPFSTQNRVSETAELLVRAGFHPYGHEILYNGQTGEMMEAEFFMAPTYYIRSKLMVEDKINFRATGPKKLLTHQPVEGRANEGGLRIGEMERDCLITHGVSKFLNESLMERSDKTEVLFQPESGLLDANPELVSTMLTTPYALSLTVHELESMHISMKLVSDSS